jgi:hypothetical protein
VQFLTVGDVSHNFQQWSLQGCNPFLPLNENSQPNSDGDCKSLQMEVANPPSAVFLKKPQYRRLFVPLREGPRSWWNLQMLGSEVNHPSDEQKTLTII